MTVDGRPIVGMLACLSRVCVCLSMTFMWCVCVCVRACVYVGRGAGVIYVQRSEFNTS